MGGPSKVIGTEETVSTGGLTRGDGRQTFELEQGAMVGEYRVEGELGAGGMGKVYAATHPVIAKRAAIKVLHPELSVNTEAVERFIQEARSVNQIGHPNIVDIFAFGTLPDGRSYFVMEWLRGQSLRDRMRKGLLPIHESLQILDTVGAALEAAHEKGIVHRDLKPDNIFLVEIKGSPTTVKLLDFGIAKLLGTDDARAEKTRTGNLLGTPGYISPEQARGYAVDHRTDIYALGALLHEMMTGWLPFPSDNAADMIAKHLYEQPPLATQRNPNVPRQLDALIVAMLAKDANHRPTIEQVRAQLRSALTQPMGPPSAIYTPPHGIPQQHSQMPMHTPAPGTTQTPAGPVSAYRTAPPPPAARKSKAPVIILSALLAAGLGVGVFVAMSNGGGDKTEPAATDTKPVEPTPAETKPAEVKAVETKPVETKPTEPAADTKPVETKPTEPAADTKPVETKPTEPVADTKPVETKPATKPTKPIRKRPTKPTTKPVDDDDAPMERGK